MQIPKQPDLSKMSTSKSRFQRTTGCEAQGSTIRPSPPSSAPRHHPHAMLSKMAPPCAQWWLALARSQQWQLWMQRWRRSIPHDAFQHPSWMQVGRARWIGLGVGCFTWGWSRPINNGKGIVHLCCVLQSFHGVRIHTDVWDVEIQDIPGHSHLYIYIFPPILKSSSCCYQVTEIRAVFQ